MDKILKILKIQNEELIKMKTQLTIQQWLIFILILVTTTIIIFK